MQQMRVDCGEENTNSERQSLRVFAIGSYACYSHPRMRVRAKSLEAVTFCSHSRPSKVRELPWVVAPCASPW